MQELHTLRSTYFHASSEFLAEQAIAEESKPGSTNVEQSGKEETRAKLAWSSGPTYFANVEIPMKERKFMSIPACPEFKG